VEKVVKVKREGGRSKMVKKRQKRSKTKIALGIGVIAIALIILSGYLISTTIQSETSLFYSEDFGMIKTKVSVASGIAKFFQLFQQAVTFSKTTANVGDEITFTDKFVVWGLNQGCRIGDMRIDIDGPRSHSLTYNLEVVPTAVNFKTITYNTKFEVDEVGTYTASTIYYEADCGVFGTRDCMSTANCYQFFTQPSKNDVVVSSVPGSCDLTPTCDKDNLGSKGWSQDASNSISNGHVEVRTCYEVSGTDENCQYTLDEKEYQTICNSKYEVTGTDNKQIAEGIKTCSLIEESQNDDDDTCTTNSDCTSPEICHPSTKLCVATDCDVDKTIACGGATIITMKCSNKNADENGILVPTGDTCVEGKVVKIDKVDKNDTAKVTKTPRQNCLDTAGTWDDSDETCDCNNDEKIFDAGKGCVNKGEISLIVWVSIIGGIAILIAIIVIVIRRRK